MGLARRWWQCCTTWAIVRLIIGAVVSFPHLALRRIGNSSVQGYCPCILASCPGATIAGMVKPWRGSRTFAVMIFTMVPCRDVSTVSTLHLVVVPIGGFQVPML